MCILEGGPAPVAVEFKVRNPYEWGGEDQLNRQSQYLRLRHCLRSLPTITPDHHTDPSAISEDAERSSQLSDTIAYPVIIFFVVILLLDPAVSPDFALDSGSDRMISANAVVFAAEAKVEEASGKHLETTDPIPFQS